MELSLISSRNCASGVVIGDLVVGIIGDKTHIKRRVAMRVLRCRHHMNMWICYWFIIIVFTASVAAIVVWVHCEVNQDSLIRNGDFKEL